MSKANGKGYGKVILFGEHFVVYGIPGIASGIDKFVDVTVENIKDKNDVIFDDTVFNEKVSLNEKPDHIKSKIFKAIFNPENKIIKEILEFNKIEFNNLKFTIKANFSAAKGLGYSGALAVAIIRSVNNLFELDLKDNHINELAYIAECVSHGTPSGIDNTCATYGTLVWFEKNMTGGPNTVKPFKCGKPLYLVLADTGIKHDTKESVANVRKRKEANESDYKKIFDKAKKLASKAKKELQYGAILEIGKLMNENQELLREIGVSCKEAEEIIKVCEYENSVAGKVTGAGDGGNVIILCENEKHQDKIIETIKRKNYEGIKIKIS
ncbi:MAG: mevalonate kinase [Candidatus ainarchaeum sp.]|nr:mevalonate kinase [Candidatus ainarchaeum sp.]